MSEFKQRYIPQGTGRNTYGDLAAHVAASDPHFNYVTREHFEQTIASLTVSSGGSSDTVAMHEAKADPHAQYILVSELNEVLDAHIAVKDSNNNTRNPHPQYAMVSSLDGLATTEYVDEKIAAINIPEGTAISLVGTMNGSAPNIGDDTVALAGHYGAYLRGLIETHTEQKNISIAGFVDPHQDTDGNPLYAYRVHSHTAGDVGAAESVHVHDSLYLVPEDVYSNRVVKALAWVNGTSYIFTEDVNGANVPPAAGAQVYTDHNLIHPLDNGIISEYLSTSNAIVVNGITYARSTSGDHTVLNVTGLTNIFSEQGHQHDDYLLQSSLEMVGIYPSALINTNTTEYDFDSLITQGNYYIDSTATGVSVLNAPITGCKGILSVHKVIVVESQSSIDEDNNLVLIVPGKEIIYQTFRDVNGKVYTRCVESVEEIQTVTETSHAYAWVYNDTTVYTSTTTPTVGEYASFSDSLIGDAGEITATTGTSITAEGIVYTRSLSGDTTTTNTSEEIVAVPDATPWMDMTNGDTVTESSTTVNTAACTLSGKNVDVHRITLTANTVLTITDLRQGQTLEVYVTSNSDRTLTFGGVVILDKEDIGDFVITFKNVTGSAVACIGIATVLASQPI